MLVDVSGLTRSGRALVFAGVLASLCGCGSALATPESRPHQADDFAVVPYPPPSALVEIVPPAPDSSAVWVNGYWAWGGRHYIWERGGWVRPPPGSFVRKWAARYEADGTLLYAPTTWHSSDGRRIPPPEFLVPAATPPTAETPEPATVP